MPSTAAFPSKDFKLHRLKGKLRNDKELTAKDVAESLADVVEELDWFFRHLRDATIQLVQQSIRPAYCAASAGSGSSIACRLDNATSGQIITVYCSVTGGTDLNSAIPRLESGTLLPVWKNARDDKWYAFFPFQATEDCE